MIPRRIRLDLCTPAEVAIYNAMQEVEKMGADTTLTEASGLLDEARNLIADYVDQVVDGAKPSIKQHYKIYFNINLEHSLHRDQCHAGEGLLLPLWDRK
jgi:hypothetical protein